MSYLVLVERILPTRKSPYGRYIGASGAEATGDPSSRVWGRPPVEKLKARLRAVAMQRDYVMERLARTDEELQRGRDSLETYVALLSQPESLYERAIDLVRRQLLEAFFPPLFIDMRDEVKVQGDAHPAVRTLTALERPFHDEPATNETSPDLSVGTRLIRTAELFFAPFQPNGWNKSALVDVVDAYSNQSKILKRASAYFARENVLPK